MIKAALKEYIKSFFNSFGTDIIRFPKSASHRRWLNEISINNVVDIGANQGQFTKKILKVLPESKIFCFEPLPDEYNFLKKKFSNYPNISFFNYALGNKAGKTFFQKNKFSPSSSILEMSENHKANFPFTASTSKIEVMLERLDSFLKTINPDDKTLIKIDVQGYESEVILGGEEVIKRSKVILIETSFRELYTGQKLFEDIYRHLNAIGYKYKGSSNNVYSSLSGEILQADSPAPRYS